ncbi:apolipoprotein N-acyltransferase [Vitreoscilla stercoraria]|nr:apolipoprotein N-acyltransferase [Vitreoscilla stercoraria]
MPQSLLQRLASSPIMGALLMVISAALTPFAYAPYRLYWLMPILLAVMLIVAFWHERYRLRLVYLWAWVTYFVQCYWINTALHDVSGLPLPISIPLTALLPMYLALYPTLTIWLCEKIRLPDSGKLLLVFPAVWTLTEFVRERAFTGFGWGALGYTQIAESPLAGYAPVSGIALVTWATALIGAAIAGLILCKPIWQKSLHVAVSMLIVAIGVNLSQHHWTERDGTQASVALLQGNIPQTLKWEPEAFAHTIQVYYELLTQAEADIVIMPETAIPLMRQDLPEGLLTQFVNTAHRQNAALAIGIPEYTHTGRQYLNSIINFSSFDPEKPDQALPTYSKNHLVPFGEFKPQGTQWLYQMMNMPLADFSAGGKNQAPLALANQKIAFNICYEDSFGDELIASAQQASLLSNVSNMAWYGTSHAMDLQLQQSQARALELGRYMVRATNTGLTAVVDPKGHIVSLAPRDTQQILTTTIHGYQGETPYMRLGGTWPLAILLSVWLLILFIYSQFRPNPQSY